MHWKSFPGKIHFHLLTDDGVEVNADISQADAERALDTMARICDAFDSEGVAEIRELYQKVRFISQSNSNSHPVEGPTPIVTTLMKLHLMVQIHYTRGTAQWQRSLCAICAVRPLNFFGLGAQFQAAYSATVICNKSNLFFKFPRWELDPAANHYFDSGYRKMHAKA